jgi:hypothetical protein
MVWRLKMAQKQSTQDLGFFFFFKVIKEMI